MGDIEKAFLKIAVDKSDRDSLRLVLVDDVLDPCSKGVVYHFFRVVFGLNASPITTLRHELLQYKIL